MSFWQDEEYAEFWLDLARGDLATWLQITPYAYAALEGIHLVGVAFFFGAIVLLDLRLLGFVPRLDTRSAARFLLLITIPAFAVIAASGALMFVASADRYAVSPIFSAKLAAVAAGGLNALAFHVARRRGDHRNEPMRAAAVASMLLWIGVIVLGRAMGYERREPPPGDVEWLLELEADAGQPDR